MEPPRMHLRSLRPQLRDPAEAWSMFRKMDDPSTVMSSADLRAAFGICAHNDERLAAAFERADVLASPTTPETAPPAEGDGKRHVGLTWAFNLSGHPAISLPAGLDRRGLPVGLQLVGRRGADEQLLRVAARIEAALPSLPWPPGTGHDL